MKQNNKNTGEFFKINNKKYATIINMKTHKKFEKLITKYTTNIKPFVPKPNDKITFLPIDDILQFSYDKLKNDYKANDLVITLMAQNNIKTSINK